MSEQARKTICQILDSERALLAEVIATRHFAAHPELTERYGDEGKKKCVLDAAYHLAYLTDAVAAASPTLFADYLAWAKVMLRSRGVPATDLSRNISIMHEVVREKLPAELATLIDEHFDAGLSQLPSAVSDPPTHMADAGAHTPLATKFLRLLLNGERHAASRLINDAVDAGMNVRDVYLFVFQPSQRELGRLWQTNQISVAQEHYCTAATQQIMAQLYPRIFRTERNGKKIVATSIGGELHEIGIRIVADFFEMEGWDTYYLGANSPPSTIVEALQERKADLLAVSATMTFHIRAVEDLIKQVRASMATKSVKILVGGYPFNLEPELWKRIGADSYAAGAAEAVAAASQL